MCSTAELSRKTTEDSEIQEMLATPLFYTIFSLFLSENELCPRDGTFHI